MDYDKELAELRAKRDAINMAIAALDRLRAHEGGFRPLHGNAGRKRGPMSAEAKQRLSESMRAAWARRKAMSA